MTEPTREVRTSDQLRAAYLAFFQEKGHLVVPSSSLIPEGDPTLLLTSAGMVQFKPYFTGELTPPNPRLTSCQKCFRATDIDSVGDPKHLTFFEMLGNFSIGDYFKEEAIAWAWEFATERLKLPKENLWITIYLDDEEAFGHWRSLGVPAEKIVRYGEKDNFWGPAGEEGPCGPCSEIHYDYGVDPSVAPHSCEPSCPCGRFVELWNLVFTQYNQDRQGNRTPLPKPNIDTGMGLERTAAVLQGKHTVYESDVFAMLVQKVSGMAGRTYGTGDDLDYSTRVVAEHGRSVVFLIADGVIPSNEGRGYLLRRILRRAVRFGRRLGLDSPFLGEIVQTVTDNMHHVYPELERNRDFILKVIELEETRFSQTLSRGLELFDTVIVPLRDQLKEMVNILNQSLGETVSGEQRDSQTTTIAVKERLKQADEEMQRLASQAAHTEGNLALIGVAPIRRCMESLSDNLNNPRVTGFQDIKRMVEAWKDKLLREVTSISGFEVFTLHDTYGFPPELTEEIARDRGYSIDMDGFRQEMDRQREQARASARFGLGPAGTREMYQQLGIGGNRFAGYDSLSERSVIVGLLVEGEPRPSATQGHKVEVVLRETPFYAEMGGQVGDSGEIIAPGGKLKVEDTQMPLPGLIVHKGEITEGTLSVGDPVEAIVAASRRNDTARNHTSTHLLHAALRKVLGTHVRQAGSLVAPERLRFDYSHLTALSPGELMEVQHLVNEKAREDLRIHWELLPYQEAIDRGALAFFGEKYGDRVRIVEIGDGEPFSLELCGGTHLTATGQVGFCLILGESSIGSGMRRIEAITGRAYEEFIGSRLSALENIARRLETSPSDLEARVEVLLKDLDRERKRSASMEREMLRGIGESLVAQKQTVSGIPVVAGAVPASSVGSLRELGDWLKARLGSGVLVLGTIVEDKPAFVVMVTPDLVSRGLHAGEIVKRVAAIAGGSGGGRPEMAQAGGRDASKLNDALNRAASVVQELAQGIGKSRS